MTSGITFGSLKIEQGENIKYVQVQMGHSDIEVTLDVDGHLLKKSNPEAADLIEKNSCLAVLLMGVDRRPSWPPFYCP